MPKIKFKGPFIGVQKNLDPDYVEPGECEDALNVNLDQGKIRRRPGFSESFIFAQGPVLGLYDWLKNDGTTQHFAKAGTSLLAIDPIAITSSEISTALSSSDLVSWQVVNNRLYFADSSALKVTDGTTVFGAQIARPTSAPTVAALSTAGTGNLSGDYDYKITFYSSTWGQESPASDASTLVSPDGQNVQLSGLPNAVPGGDARVDKKRIYRRKVSASESEWSFLVETTIGDTSQVDLARDNDIDFNRISPLSYTDTFPAFRYLAYQGGVLFLAGSDAFPNRLYYTLPDQPYEVDSFLSVGSGGDSDPITGVWAFGGLILVLKKRSVWTLSGNSKDTFFLRQISKGVGCAGHHSIVEMDGMLYWLGERTFYKFDGAEMVDIGDPISPDMSTRNFSRDKYVVGAHDFQNHSILWSYSSNGSAVNDTCYAYFYSNSDRVGKPSWSPWRYGTKHLTALALMFNPTASTRQMVLGFHTGLFATAGGDSDEGLEIQLTWRTHKFDGGVPDKFKRWCELSTQFTRQESSSACDVNYYIDDGSQSLLATHDTTEAIFRRHVGHSSRDLRLEYSSYKAAALEIVSFEIEASVCGRD